ncbi:MAG: YraN family protein [Patescibacteria group bacterium]|mgnify:CR=1 FL=1
MFKSKTSAIGAIGEDLACDFLIKKGYKILKRNYWKPWGELDIIAKDRDGVIVFVEVKAMRRLPANSDLQPEDNLTRAKLIKLKRTAELFVSSRPELVDEERGYQIDLLAIVLEPFQISHYENV